MTKIRFDTTIGMAAAALLAFATPATAASGTANRTAEPAPAAAQPHADRADQRRICVRTEFSGSRMARRICKTAQEWEAAGGVPSQDR